MGFPKLNPDEQKQKNAKLRGMIEGLKADPLKYVEPTNADAMRKVFHYIRALDAQIAVSHNSDKILDQLFSPMGSRR